MVAGSKYRLLAAAAALVIAASCNPGKGPNASPGANDPANATQQPSSASTPATPSAAVVADPCADPNGRFQQSLCQNAKLAPLVSDVHKAIAAAATSLSPEGGRDLAADQMSWLEATRVACGIDQGAATLTADQQSCLSGALEQRKKEAKESVTKMGGFTFRTAEVNAADRVPQALLNEYGLTPDVGAVEKRLRFPKIEGDSPQIRKFNRLMEQRPEAAPGEQTNEHLDYKIAFAAPDLVSVRFDRSDYALGAAHPNNGAKAVTVVMSTGEALKPSDVFAAPEDRWKAALTAKAKAGLLKKLTQMGADTDVSDHEIADTATKVQNWVITKEALVVLFPEDSVGPHALGDLEVAIPWGELRDLLNPNGPGPIGRH